MLFVRFISSLLYFYLIIVNFPLLYFILIVGFIMSLGLRVKVKRVNFGLD